jgi:hypothetical protein
MRTVNAASLTFLSRPSNPRLARANDNFWAKKSKKALKKIQKAPKVF